MKNTFASVVFAVAVAGTNAPAMAAIHAGDEINVSVFDHPELSGLFIVDARERISIPLAGTIDVRAISPELIAARIRTRLAAYILKPAVSVQTKTQQASLFVSGGPGGILKYEPGETLLTALGELAPRATEVTSKDGALAAGDLSTLQRSRIDLQRVRVVRDSVDLGTFDAIALAATGKPAPRLMPGDTIVLVDKPKIVRVLGDVPRPGLAYLSEEEPLSNAITQVGGTLVTAATANIELHRAQTKTLLALGDRTFNAPAVSGDEIFVPSAPRISMAGLVEKPGSVALKTDTSLLSALYEAGGPTTYADLKHVEVLTGKTTTSYDITRLIHGDMSQNPQLHDGDLVFVPEGHKISFAPLFQSIFGAVPFLSAIRK